MAVTQSSQMTALVTRLGKEIKALKTSTVVVPTKTSQLENDSGFLTEHQSLADYAKAADVPTRVSQLENDAGYGLASSIPTKVSELTNDASYATTSAIPTKVSQLTNDSGYALTSSIPTKTSQLTNDSGYLTSHQSLASCLKTTGGTISGNLAVTGTCTVSGALQGKTVKATSDRRLKENLTTPTYDLSSLKAYRYTFTGEPVYHVGLIAQEVKRVIPEAVAEGENGYLALDYNAVVAALVNAVNSLQAQINQLKEAKNG